MWIAIILGVIFQNDINKTAMQLLGKIAEAIIVRNCHNDELVNQKYFSIARKKRAYLPTSNRFFALGTGMHYTQINYHKFYNPSDTQRDVIWINEQNEAAIMMDHNNISTTTARMAGLQIKATRNGIRYVLPDIIQDRYDVPIIYFDVENDYHKILNKIYKDTKVNLEYDIIHPREIDPQGYDEFINYVDLVYAMVNNRLKPKDLVFSADKNDDSIMKNVLLSTTLSNINKPNIMIV